MASISHSGICCIALSSLLGSKVSFPNTSSYNSSVESFYSDQNANIRPLCIVTPTNTEDVSTVLKTITLTSHQHATEADDSQCHFAVRSGSHMAHAGSNNIQNGVTIDLSSLNTVKLSEDHTTASVGVGAKWGDVYAFLDPLGFSVAGGRASPVGVGGLSLGGGISYLSPRYGWTADTVTGFEIVLANGTIAEMSDKRDPEFMRGLRGGGGNFGITTRVDLRAFEQGPIWGGNVYYALDTVDEQLAAFSGLNSADGYDEFASLITNFVFAAGVGPFVDNNIVYTRAEGKPGAFEKFLQIPSLQSTLRVASMHNVSAELGEPSTPGKRQFMTTATHGSTLPMLQAAFQRWNSSLSAIENVPGIVWSLVLEPLPPSIYAQAPERNSLGLDDASEALVVAVLIVSWDNEADDATVEETARAMFNGIEEDARRLDSYNPYVYLNYAAKWQDPIASYGIESVKRLQRLSRRVDPKGVFKGAKPGGFKVPL